MGIKVEVSPFHRDLGIMYTAAGKRNKSLVQARIRRAKVRNPKICRVTKFSRSARKLFNTGFLPQATWGHQSYGFSPTDFLRLRRMAADTTGIVQKGRCLTSSMQIRFGRKAHAMLKCVKEVVALWFDHLWALIDNNMDSELRGAWSKPRNRVKPEGKLM